jgi:transposase-like protein
MSAWTSNGTATGKVTNRLIYVVIVVTVDGERNLLGLWAGDGGERCAGHHDSA